MAPCAELPGVALWLSVVAVSAAVDCQGPRSSWSMQQKAACAPSAAPPASSTAGPFDCRAGRGSWAVAWSAEKIFWCCQPGGGPDGCPVEPTPTPTAAATAATAAATSSTAASVTTTATTTATTASQPPTTSSTTATITPRGVRMAPSSGCNATCFYYRTAATCSERIQYAANNRFSARPESCSLAHAMVLQQCPTCVNCHHDATGCTTVPLQTPVSTTDPPEDTPGCRLQCSFEGNVTTCGKLVRWGARSLFASDPHNCTAAHSMVNRHCPQCSSACPASASACAAPGMKTTRAPLSVMGMPYDCLAGYDVRNRVWSPAKKAWCCAHEGFGCDRPSTTGTSTPYDCLAGFSNWRNGWSASKKKWCCFHRLRGCPDTTTTTATATTTPSAPFDCVAGLDNWQHGWSVAKKLWCCQHEGRGCSSTPFVAYDCSAGLANWIVGWSADKKAWCCHREGRGCQPDPAVSFECRGGLTMCHSALCKQQRAWCCKHQHVGCSDAKDYDRKFNEQELTRRKRPQHPAAFAASIAGCLGLASTLAVVAAARSWSARTRRRAGGYRALATLPEPEIPE
mmetsp:Transcript_103333/g.313571  ORF Transcript_103333/g.313571 Transcript_103333/m.313571 type:complete len:569 (-) Transcript_103333:17-1723(-)